MGDAEGRPRRSRNGSCDRSWVFALSVGGWVVRGRRNSMQVGNHRTDPCPMRLPCRATVRQATVVRVLPVPRRDVSRYSAVPRKRITLRQGTASTKPGQAPPPLNVVSFARRAPITADVMSCSPEQCGSPHGKTNRAGARSTTRCRTCLVSIGPSCSSTSSLSPATAGTCSESLGASSSRRRRPANRIAATRSRRFGIMGDPHEARVLRTFGALDPNAINVSTTRDRRYVVTSNVVRDATRTKWGRPHCRAIRFCGRPANRLKKVGRLLPVRPLGPRMGLAPPAFRLPSGGR
jgi:hypothetical protein